MTLTSQDLRVIKEKFTSSKLILKKWEEDFKKEHGVKPNKEALTEAPKDIKDTYKSYWKYSKELSDYKKYKQNSTNQKINDEKFTHSNFNDFNNHKINDEKFNESNNEQFLEHLDKSKFKNDQKSEDILSLEKTCDDIQNIVQDDKDSRINTENFKNNLENIENFSSKNNNVWGRHLDKKQSCLKDKEVNVDSSFYFQMAEKMKNNASVKIRNVLKKRKNSLHLKKSLSSNVSTSNNIPITFETKSLNRHNSLPFADDADSKSPEHYANLPDDSTTIFNSENIFNFTNENLPSNNISNFNHSFNESLSNMSEESNITKNSKNNITFSNLKKSNDSNESNSGTSFVTNNCDTKSLNIFSNTNYQIVKKLPNSNSQPVNILSQNNVSLNKNYDKNWLNRLIGSLSDDDKETSDVYKEQIDCVKDKAQTNGLSILPIESLGNNSINNDLTFNSSCKQSGPLINSSQEKRKMEQVTHNSKRFKVSDDHSNTGYNIGDKNDNSEDDYLCSSEDELIKNKCDKSIKQNKILNPVESKDKEPEEDSFYDELFDSGTSKILKNNNSGNKKFLTKEERLQKKVDTGKLNENFVKINIKKKVFVRGKKRMTAEKYKRSEWKKKQVMKRADEGDERSVKKLTCFRCGDFGHWAKYCPGKIGDSLMPLDQYDEGESTFLSLEEAADLARGIKSSSSINVSKVYEQKKEDINLNCATCNDSDDDMFSATDSQNSQENSKIISSQENCPNTSVYSAVKNDYMDAKPLVPPVYQTENVNTLLTPTEVFETLKLFGYNTFRKGQEQTIMRILCGYSTLLILSTGSGKSLCYQLPAYIYAQKYKCITLCISPLVSLMEDQVDGLPSFLNAVCLHTHQSTSNREKALSSLRSGNAHILLVSPEAVVSSQGGGLLGSILKEIPPIAFACLDEAHCISEWSHNFRPSYLQLCRVLKENLKVNTFLGLTATARKETALSIAKHIGIPNIDMGIIAGACIPDNLILSVSKDENREEALIYLLTGERFSKFSSIIIYCTRREECERIATFIRTQMIVPSKIDIKSNSKRNRGISLDAEAYHAGLSAHRRQQIQKKFMSGKLRIVVATVAFGMGIDKSDVQGIIHFNMPRNLESYVQEIGRAGRDGNEAHCHLFLDSCDGRDIQELKRHIFVNSVDRFMVRKLLNKVFVPCVCTKVDKLSKETDLSQNNSSHCQGHELALPIQPLIEVLDLPEENIQTLLCYLELHPKCRLKLDHHVYSTCNISCYRGPKQLCLISRNCPPLAAAVALQRQTGKEFENKSSISFPVVQVASHMGWDSRIVKRELKRLEWNTTKLNVSGRISSSGVKVEFCDLAFHIICRGDLSEEEQDEMLEMLFQRACNQELAQLKQLQYTYEVLQKASHKNVSLCKDLADKEKSSYIKNAIMEYFDKTADESLASIQLEEQLYIRPELEQRIRSDIRALISTHSDQTWTGRAVARVLHGIGSPNFPANIWGRVRRFWRSHLETDFNLLVRLATKEILKFK